MEADNLTIWGGRIFIGRRLFAVAPRTTVDERPLVLLAFQVFVQLTARKERL